MPTLVTDLVDLADAIIAILSSPANMLDSGLQAVFYGDQSKLPTTPVACVETDIEVNDIRPTRRTNQTFTVYVLVYYAAVGSSEDNRRAADDTARKVKNQLNSDPQLRNGDLTGDGKVIHSFVSEVQSGIATKGGTPVRASRLTLTATSIEQLPMS